VSVLGLSPGRAARGGPVSWGRWAKTVTSFDGLAGLADPVEVVPDPWLGPVLPRQGGDDVNVILGVPDRDPSHRIVVAESRETGAVHDLFRDLRPLGVGKNRIVGRSPGHAMPYRLVEPLSNQRGGRLAQQSVEPTEIPRSVAPERGLQFRRMPPPGDQAWVDVLLPPAWAVQIPDET